MNDAKNNGNIAQKANSGRHFDAHSAENVWIKMRLRRAFAIHKYHAEDHDRHTDSQDDEICASEGKFVFLRSRFLICCQVQTIVTKRPQTKIVPSVSAITSTVTSELK